MRSAPFKDLKLNLVILIGWLTLAAIVGVTDHMFNAWSVPSTLYVVKQTHLYSGNLRVAGPFIGVPQCEKVAKKSGTEAFCIRLTSHDAKKLLSATSWTDVLERK